MKGTDKNKEIKLHGLIIVADRFNFYQDVITIIIFMTIAKKYL